ncbi:MAG: hypothetical protein LBQ52_08065 [Helicobacteraceae bacterium]|jgi:hypothetical protein|nr:hypothetical protein [Helicobacteraceae bacterium]
MRFILYVVVHRGDYSVGENPNQKNSRILQNVFDEAKPSLRFVVWIFVFALRASPFAVTPHWGYSSAPSLREAARSGADMALKK